MREIRWRAVALAAVVAAAACGPQQSLTEEQRGAMEDEVAVFVDSLFAAMNAHDVDAIAAHYDRTEAFTYVGCTSIRTGFESLERVMQAYYTANPDVSFDHEVATTRILDRQGAVATVTAATGDDVTLYWSFVLRRSVSGEWRITYEHESWPECPAPRRHPAM